MNLSQIHVSSWFQSFELLNQEARKQDNTSYEMPRDIIKQPYTNKQRRRATKNYNKNTVKSPLFKNVKKAFMTFYFYLTRSSGSFPFSEPNICIH